MVTFLYLYNFVYLKQNTTSSLLVNIYNKEKLSTNSSPINNILSRIEKNRLTYNGCVLTKEECACPEVNIFLKNVVDLSFGGVVETKRNEIPVQFPAEVFIKSYTDEDEKLSLAYDIANRKNGKKVKAYLERVSENIFDNFISLTVYIGITDTSIYKNVSNQYLFPTYSESIQSYQNNFFLNWIGSHAPTCVNLIVGKTNSVKEINDLIISGPEQINLYILEDVFAMYKDQLLLKDNCTVNIWKLSPGKIDECEISNLSYYCLFESEEDIEEQEKYGYSDNVYIVPFYNGRNFAFCKKYLSFSYADIVNIMDTDYRFRINRILNSTIFGDIRIMHSGEVYTNINRPAVGNVFDFSLRDILFIEIAKVRNWFETRRSVEPCCNCLYSDLCPPISDFENFCNKYNLCKNFSIR